MNCINVCGWWEIAWTFAGCALVGGGSLTLVAWWLIVFIRWAWFDQIPEKKPPTPPMTYVQKALLQAQKRGDGAWTLRGVGEEDEDG